MEEKTLRCPNCGANATNHDNCEYCGSLLVRLVDNGIDVDAYLSGHKALPGLSKALKEMGFSVKLDTNGSFPDKLKAIVEKGLVDYVAMDIKNSKAKYMTTIGIDSIDLASIEKSVDFLLQNKVPYEFRTTIVNGFHTLEDIQDIVVWIKGAHKYFLQNFVDSGDLISDGLEPVSVDLLKEMQKKASEIIPSVEIRGI